MNSEPHPTVTRQDDVSTEPRPRRLFVHEPGWRVALKVGSDRMFCYMMAPGQDYYHRLLDGEVYVVNGDERVCLACAAIRGLLSYESRGLGGTVTYLDLEAPHGSQFELRPPFDNPDL